MTVRQQLAVQNDCYRRNQGEMEKNPGERDSRYARYYQGPQGVMIHSTGAENPNLRRYVQPDDGTLARLTFLWYQPWVIPKRKSMSGHLV